MVSQAVSLRSLASIIGLLFLSMLAPLVMADSFEASVDRSSIAEQETLRVSYRFSPQVIMGTPDFSPLQQDFDILQGPSRINSFQSSNGQIESHTEWTLVLTPRHSGQLTIPAITFKGETSNPINIRVSQQAAQVQQNNENAFFDIQISQQPAYLVQSEILYTEKLYFRVNHSDANLTDLEVEDARVEAIGEPRQYISSINGERVGVYERRFAIYPQKTGTLVIPGQRFQAMTMLRTGRSGPLSATSRPIELTITPIPANYPPHPWLPARSLTIDERFSVSDDQWVVGEAVTRTIRIDTQGLPASQIVLPDPVLPDGLKRYPDQPVMKDQMTDEGVTGHYQLAEALVPTRPGQLLLPEQTLAWWNTRTNQLEYARLPAHTINVKPAANSTTAAPPPAPAVTTPAAISGSVTADAQVAPVWQWLTGILLASNLLTLGLWWRARTFSAAIQPQQNFPVAAADPRALWQTLKNSCQQRDPAAVRQALLAWAATVCEQPVRSLQALRQQVDDPALQTALAELDATLFSAHNNSAWNGQNLLVLLERWQASHQSKRPMGMGELYPS